MTRQGRGPLPAQAPRACAGADVPAKTGSDPRQGSGIWRGPGRKSPVDSVADMRTRVTCRLEPAEEQQDAPTVA